MEEDSSKGCVACGWTLEQQEQCSYSSHVKLFYGASRRGVWSIGSDVILKERPNEGPKNEAKTLEYLSNNPDIPAPKLIRDWVDNDGRYFVLQERIKGQTLEQAWPALSQSQKTAIADQIVQVRQKLRSSRQSPYKQSIKAHVIQGYSLLTVRPTDRLALTSNCGMRSALCFITR
jgi:hypothetical protein